MGSGPSLATRDNHYSDQIYGSANDITYEQSGVHEELDHVKLQELLHYGPEDGQREGWLAQQDEAEGGCGGNEGQHSEEGPGHVRPNQGDPMMRASQYNSQGIIVPGRIWDGGQRDSRLHQYPRTWAWGGSNGQS